jgi:hypothetical protein
MPVEFALRPRIRLRDELAPPRRSRLQLPRFVLPVAAYWLAVSGIVYAFVHSHEPAQLPPLGDAPALDRELVSRPNPAWWERAPREPPAPTPAAEGEVRTPAEPQLPAEPERKTEPERALAPQAERALGPEPTAEAEPRHKARGGATALPQATVPPLIVAPLPVADEIAASPPSANPPSASESRDSGAFPSCEAAIASANQGVDFSSGNAADLASEAIAAVLDGPWIQSCNVPESSAVEVCVAIRGGSVVGASVATRPSNVALSRCLKQRARALQFPYSSRTDIARTRF